MFRWLGPCRPRVQSRGARTQGHRRVRDRPRRPGTGSADPAKGTLDFNHPDQSDPPKKNLKALVCAHRFRRPGNRERACAHRALRRRSRPQSPLRKRKCQARSTWASASDPEKTPIEVKTVGPAGFFRAKLKADGKPLAGCSASSGHPHPVALEEAEQN